MAKNKLIKIITSLFAFASLAFCFGLKTQNIKSTNAAEKFDDRYDTSVAIYKSIEWNNTVYTPFDVTTIFGELDKNGVPQDGLVFLSFFKYNDASIADADNNPTLGKIIDSNDLSNSNFATKKCAEDILINGTSVNNVTGAQVYIYPGNGIIFYVPTASLPENPLYLFPCIEISKITNLGNCDIAPVTFEFTGDYGVSGGWHKLNASRSELKQVEFAGVAGGHNNVVADSPRQRYTILQFGVYGDDYLDESKLPNGENLATKDRDCGKFITINGVPLYEIEGTTVSYLHGNCYVYLVFPVNALVPSNGFDVVTLHITDKCLFRDVLLSEVTLYLFNNEWVSESPTVPDIKDYDTAYGINDVFGSNDVLIDEKNNSASGTKAAVNDVLGFVFDYKLSTDQDSFSMFIFGTTNQNGIRLMVSGSIISLYDATDGSNLLGSFKYGQFNPDDWSLLFINGKLKNNALSVSVAIDNINYLVVNDIHLADASKIGDKFTVYAGSGIIEFKDGTPHVDNKKPEIYYSGKAVYGVVENSEAINFKNKVVAFDTIDGDISNNVIIIWQDGALTNNYVNKGDWVVQIEVEDAAKNKNSMSVVVICRDKLDAQVTFDGKNSTDYKIGDYISQPADPVSEDQYEEFVGWYFNDMPWDFENDYVVGNMNLVAKFSPVTKEFVVNITTTGLASNNNYQLYFKAGTVINPLIFNVNGYSLVAKVNGEAVTSFVVNKNINLILEYTNLNGTKNGCGGSIIASSILISCLCGGAIILLSLRKKEEN